MYNTQPFSTLTVGLDLRKEGPFKPLLLPPARKTIIQNPPCFHVVLGYCYKSVISPLEARASANPSYTYDVTKSPLNGRPGKEKPLQPMKNEILPILNPAKSVYP